MSNRPEFFAHSHRDQPIPGDKWQALALHLREVARLAEVFGLATKEMASVDITGAAQEREALASLARSAGLLHDVGKYQQQFQTYLREVAKGEPHAKVPHAPLGAGIALCMLGVPNAFVIAGHHQGLTEKGVLRRYQQEWNQNQERVWES